MPARGDLSAPSGEPPRLALTGATGFIGRHLLAELDRAGVACSALIRRPCGLMADHPAVHWVVGDLDDGGDGLWQALGRPTMLIHLAWGGLPHYASSHHLEQELPRQTAFLQRLVAQGLPALLVAGTCAEYGRQSGALSEQHPAQPVLAYARAKHALHTRLLALQAEHAFRLCWVRPFYMYGPGQAPSALWSQLQAAIDRGDRAFKLSGGEQLRDFLPVGEVAACLHRLACADQPPPLVNIASGQPRSVRSLVESWCSARASRIRLDFGAYPYPDYEAMAFWGTRTVLDAALAAAP